MEVYRTRVQQQGSVFIELLVALGLLSVIGFSITSISFDTVVADRVGGERQEALVYAQEGLEAARQIRDRSWGLLASGDHGVITETVGPETRFAFSGTSDTREIFTRAVKVEDVQRDASSNIVSAGGTVDPDTRRVTSQVIWAQGAPAREVMFTEYLTNWKGLSWTETLKSEFSQGTLTSAQAVDAPPPPTGDGSVKLVPAPGGGGTVQVLSSVDFNASGPADGRDVAVQGGYAYFVTSLGAGNARFYVADVSDASSPKKISELGNLGKLYNVAVSGNYAYLATAIDTAELRVVNITNPASPTAGVGIDTDSTSDGQSVAVSGSSVYLGTVGNTSAAPHPEFYVFSAINPASPVATKTVQLLGSPSVLGIAPVGDRAYLATTHDTAEVMIVDLAPATPVVYTMDLPNQGDIQDARGIAVSGSRAYVTRGRYLFVLSLANPLAPTVLGQVDLGADAYEVAVAGSYAYVATAKEDTQFQRVNIEAPSTPRVDAIAGLRDDSAVGRGIAVDGSYAYMATNSNDQELVIVANGGGGTLGIYGTFDAPGNDDGRAVALSGTTAFLGVGKFLYAIDVSNPLSPVKLDEIDLLQWGNTVEDIALRERYAYVALSGGLSEIVVIDLSNPADLRQVGAYDDPGLPYDGLGLDVAGTRLYAALGDRLNGAKNSALGRFLVLDISNPVSPTLLGAKNSLDMRYTDVTVDATNGNVVYLTGAKPGTKLTREVPSSMLARVLPRFGVSESVARSWIDRWVEHLRSAVGAKQSLIREANAQSPACSDTVDNDADTKVDYPNDPGCTSTSDTDETDPPLPVECSDNVDNDGDTQIDYPNDTGCESAADPSERFQCSDTLDNDLDTRIDLADFNCTDPNDNSEAATQCADSVDNDGNFLIDFPSDPGCTGTEDTTEGPGSPSPSPSPSPPPAQCSDGLDNDNDTFFDYGFPEKDQGCTSSSDNDESNTSQCSDGLDNDGDGRADWQDPECEHASDQVEQSSGSCTDGTDNDDDGKSDLSDADCPSGLSFCEFQANCNTGQPDQGDVQRVDVSNPASPTTTAYYEAPALSEEKGTGADTSGSSIYLVASNKGFGASNPEFFILKYTGGVLGLESPGSALDAPLGNPPQPWEAEINAIAVYDPYAYLATSVGNFQLALVDISNHASPFIAQSVSLGNPGSGVAARALAVSGPYTYLATTNDTAELVIVKGAGAEGFATSGTDESIAFDAGQARLWEGLTWIGVANGGTIRFQARWATPTGSQTCAQALGAKPYVGPSESSSSYYTTTPSTITNSSGQAPSGRCFQWKALLDGNGAATPELESATITFR